MTEKKKAAPRPKFPDHAAEHLKASGLSATDIKVMRLRWVSEDAGAKLLNLSKPLRAGGIHFPYFGPTGRVIKEMSRVRILPDPRDGWAEGDGVKKAPKYLQPPGTPARAYFPPQVDWKTYGPGDGDLLITEGEKKAAAASAAGFPCVGLGGVWSFMQKDLAVDFLPDLSSLNWKRKVWIAYDSDWQANKDVRKAALALAERLAARGADVRVLMISGAPADEKWGLDDFLVNLGAVALRKALESSHSLTPELEEMSDYYRRFVLVRTLACAWDEETRTMYSKNRFFDAFPDETIQALTPTGKPTRITKAEFWWKDPRKQAANRIVLEPGKPRITASGDFNTFRGWGLEPQKASTAIWAKLLFAVFQGEVDLIRWFEQWLAYPLQHPGAKLHQCVFVYGSGQGIGKSAVGRIMCDIYGEHGRVIQDDELFSTHNGWMANSLFALGDDLSFDNRKKSRSKLKVLVDGEAVEINEKFVPGYQAKNLCNFYLTANKPGALPLDPDGINRRYLVVESSKQRVLSKEWFLQDFHQWRHGSGKVKTRGGSAVFHRLMELDLVGFEPYGDAPETAAKELVTLTSQSTVEAWCARFAPEYPYQLSTLQELYALYRSEADDHLTAEGTFISCVRAYVEPLGQQRDRDTKGTGGFISLWAVKNHKKWKRASAMQRLTAYRVERGQPVPGSQKDTKKREVRK